MTCPAIEPHRCGEQSPLRSEQIDQADLKRFAEIAKEDLDLFVSSASTSADTAARTALVSTHLFSALAADGGQHYVTKKTGFRCLSVWHFFAAKDGVKAYHPLRSRRVDFGSDKFGVSCWVKHPEDAGNVGKGVNLYGRTLPVQPGDSFQDAIRRYLAARKTTVAARELTGKHMVVVWPPQYHGQVFKA